jgi:hypothetical protein
MIRSGRLSATRDPVTGGWLVEPAELHRLYPPARHESIEQPLSGVPRIAALEAQLAGKDALIEAHQGEIDDLRQQRDRAQAALAVAQEQLGETLQQVRLLTDQRTASPVPVTVTAARRWWPWRR